MNAMLDQDAIRRTAQSVKPADMVVAEAELTEIQRQQNDICTQIAGLKDIASGAHQSSLRVITQDDRLLAQSRLGRLNAESVKLELSAALVRDRIRSFSDENAVAVRAALVPVRKAAAERVVRSIAELITVINAINATGASLREVGIDAVLLPEPLLSGMCTIAQSIIAAKSPQEEKR